MHQSVPQQIRTRVLNMSVGQWVRAIDMVMDEYTPQGADVDDEAEHVIKLTLLLMLTRWYDENDVCLLLDSTKFRLPKKLEESSRWEITKILDQIYDKDEIVRYDVRTGDEPPGETGPSPEIMAEDHCPQASPQRRSTASD